MDDTTLTLGSPVITGIGTPVLAAQVQRARTQKEVLKRQLADVVARAIRQQRLTQTVASGLLGLPQPRVSELMHGRTRNVSVERLIACLTVLGRDVRIGITPSVGEEGQLSVVALPSRKD